MPYKDPQKAKERAKEYGKLPHVRERNKQYRLKHRERLHQATKEWRRKNRKFYLAGVKRYANQNPGYNCRVFVGVPEYQKAVKSYPEDNKCQICRKIPQGERLCFDHCHISNKFRGWICRQCNIGLGKFEDSCEGLKKALAYLENFYGSI